MSKKGVNDGTGLFNSCFKMVHQDIYCYTAFFSCCGSIFTQQKKVSTAISLPWLLGFGSGYFYIGNDLGGALYCISELAALGIAGLIYMEYIWRPKQLYSAEYLSGQKFIASEDLSALGEALAEDLMAIAGIGGSIIAYGVIRIVEILSTYCKVRSIEYRGRIVPLMGKSRTGINMGLS